MASADQISCRNLGRRSSRRPLRKAQSTTQASRRAAKRPRPRPRGMGGNRRKDHPKRGTAPRLPGQRSERGKRSWSNAFLQPDAVGTRAAGINCQVSAAPRRARRTVLANPQAPSHADPHIAQRREGAGARPKASFSLTPGAARSLLGQDRKGPPPRPARWGEEAQGSGRSFRRRRKRS